MGGPVISLGDRAGPGSPPVRLVRVDVPLAHSDEPSVRCGVLRARLTRAGPDVDVHHLGAETGAEPGVDAAGTPW